MNSLALLPNLAGPDGLIIFAFILLFFGAKKLPELARGLGSAVREFSKAKDEIEHEITRPPTAPAQIEPPRDTQPYVAKTDEEYHQEHQAEPAKTVIPPLPNAEDEKHPGPSGGTTV